MTRSRSGSWTTQPAAVGIIAFLTFPISAMASDVATGKVVWVDSKNSSLLIECNTAISCKAIPSAKAGETYTFVIPESLKGSIKLLKEGQEVTVSYDDQKEKGYVLTGLK